VAASFVWCSLKQTVGDDRQSCTGKSSMLPLVTHSYVGMGSCDVIHSICVARVKSSPLYNMIHLTTYSHSCMECDLTFVSPIRECRVID
jgi:hypothetical protein